MLRAAYQELRSRDVVRSTSTQYAALLVAFRAKGRQTVMQRLRQIAFVILFAGWMVPALMAQSARERASKKPRERTHLEIIMGVEPPPAPADRAVTIFRTIAGVWFAVALIYAGTLTIRFRRTLIG